MARRSNGEIAARREAFIRAYAMSGNGEAAAIAAGYSPSRAKQQAHRMMVTDGDFAARAREARDAWLKAQGDHYERQCKRLAEEADEAITTLADIARGPADAKDRTWAIGAQARVQAAIAILDRAGHKPIERVQASITTRAVEEALSPERQMEVLQEGVAALKKLH